MSMTWYKCKKNETIRIGTDMDLAADMRERIFRDDDLADDFSEWLFDRYGTIEIVEETVRLGKDALTILLMKFIIENAGSDDGLDRYGYIWKKEE